MGMPKPYRNATIIISLVGVLLIGLTVYFYQQATDEGVTSTSESQSSEGQLDSSNPPLPGQDADLEESDEFRDVEYLQSFVGLSEAAAAEKAEADDVPHRVVARDGEQLPVTMDYNPERVNFTIVDGTVTDARYD